MSPDSTLRSDLQFLEKASPPAFCLDILDGKLPFGIWIDRVCGDDAPDSRSSGWAARLPREELEAVREKWSVCRREGRAWDHEYRLSAGDGRTHHIVSRGLPVRNAEGGIVAWVGINLDITGMKESEEELRQSQDRFRVALESGCDLLYECDLAGGTRRWFGPVDEMLGHARDGFPPTESAWELALHPEDRNRVLRARAVHLAGGGPFHLEYRMLRRDGEVVHWLDRGKALRDRAGTPELWVGFVTDMTERRRSEDMLRKSEERRRSSQRLEVIGRLAGGVAHDFNNLLTAINGYSEIVLGELGEDSPLAPHMREVLRAGERAATLTRQLLAFSRRQVMAPKILNLSAVVRDMRKMLGEFIGPGIEIAFASDEPLAAIRADPAQVEQVILNLALNARDAMPQGGRFLIELRNVDLRAGDFPADPLEGEPRPGPYVLLSMRDSGTGMDEETKHHLFEPFYSTKGRAQGLGLSAVYGIMKQSGGHISVDSQRGEGTVLSLYWPRYDALAPPGYADPGLPLPAGGGLASGIVLIAEDEDSQRALVRTILEAQGYGVLAAGSGQEALSLAHGAGFPIDLLLADVFMPGMGGLELARTLQTRAPDLKVLFMSGFADHIQVREGILECNREFIGKPFTHADLIAKVRSVLELRRAA